MNELPDDEFGPIIVRRLARARAITLSLNARGQLKLTAPRRTSLRAIERLINESRPHIRQLLAQLVDAEVVLPRDVGDGGVDFLVADAHAGGGGAGGRRRGIPLPVV